MYQRKSDKKQSYQQHMRAIYICIYIYIYRTLKDTKIMTYTIPQILRRPSLSFSLQYDAYVSASLSFSLPI